MASVFERVRDTFFPKDGHILLSHRQVCPYLGYRIHFDTCKYSKWCKSCVKKMAPDTITTFDSRTYSTELLKDIAISLDGKTNDVKIKIKLSCKQCKL